MSALEDTLGRIFNVQHYSIRDGRGIRTVIFLKGCPARCVWCCNPESQGFEDDLYHVKPFCAGCGKCAAACEHGAIRIVDGKAEIDRAKCVKCFRCVKFCRADAMQRMGREVTVGEMLREVMRDSAMYETTGGGLTLSGGECLCQPEFSLNLIKAAREHGVGSVIETCGVCDQEVLKEAADLCTGVFMDLKIMDPELSKRYIGFDSTKILENAAAIADRSWVRFRIPLIPDINDTEENLTALAAFLKDHGRSAITVIPYHALGVDKYARLGREYHYEGDGKAVDACVERARAVLEGLGIETDLA